MPCSGCLVEYIDYRFLAKCRKQVSIEMLNSGWHTYDGKFNQVREKKAMQRYRGTK